MLSQRLNKVLFTLWQSFYLIYILYYRYLACNTAKQIVHKWDKNHDIICGKNCHWNWKRVAMSKYTVILTNIRHSVLWVNIQSKRKLLWCKYHFYIRGIPCAECHFIEIPLLSLLVFSLSSWWIICISWLCKQINKASWLNFKLHIYLLYRLLNSLKRLLNSPTWWCWCKKRRSENVQWQLHDSGPHTPEFANSANVDEFGLSALNALSPKGAKFIRESSTSLRELCVSYHWVRFFLTQRSVNYDGCCQPFSVYKQF